MRRLICKSIFGSLLLLFGLSSCCFNPYGSVRQKKLDDIKGESVIFEGQGSTRSLRSRRAQRRNKAKRDADVVTRFKSYAEQVSEQDQRDISFVVASASAKSSIALAMSQGEISSALSRIKEVHPLALLQFVARQPDLVAGIKKMQGRDWIWDMFIAELSKVFSQAASQGVITSEDIAAFTSALELDSGTVTSIVSGERWSELLDIVVS